MADPAEDLAALAIPPELRELVSVLRQLDEPKRELVIAAARGPHRLRIIPWGELEKVRGILRSEGGNAVDDCVALYDDP